MSEQCPTDSSILDTEAYRQLAPFEPFAVRAETEADPRFAADLRLSAQIAEHIQDIGGLALAVGGYARDAVMARLNDQPLASKDIDIEVYGLEFDAMVEELQKFGPVELAGVSFATAKLVSPESGKYLDFSIPRTDSKVDKGHKGFQVTGNPDMTVREAARRRDLTINALALNPLTGELIDEYGGVADIQVGILRATDNELFGDDPLRALRVMQFAGRFNFTVDPATAELCKTFDLTELPDERIGEEWFKLMTKSERPSIGLEVGRKLGIFDQLHPELTLLNETEQEAEWHPEGNVWRHTLLAVDAAAKIVRQEQLNLDDSLVVLYGALCHDLGKPATTELREKNGVTRLTAHGHEAAGEAPTRSFLARLKLSAKTIETIVPIVREHLFHMHHPEPSDKALRRFAERLQPANIRLWDLVSRCDSNGRGQPFVNSSPSFKIYQRSLELEVAEKPAPSIVQGRDLIADLQLKPGPAFGVILDWLYDAQLGDAFTTVEDGIAYYHDHEGEVQELLAEKGLVVS